MNAPAQLVQAWLASVTFAENREYLESTDRSKVSYEVESSSEIEDLARFESEDETWAWVRLDARIVWHAEGEEGQGEGGEKPATPFDLDMTLRGAFMWGSATVDERVAHAWLEYNASYLLWPYLRSYVATITGMGILPALTIYTMSVPEAPDFDSEEDVSVAEEDASIARSDTDSF